MEKKFNYHKVLFTLETYKTAEEKISYLYKVKVDLNRIIQCFSRKKFQALKKYAKPNIFSEDGCKELTDFLKEVIGYYNSPLYGDRYISDEILSRHIKEEVKKYKNFIKIVDSEINYWIEQRDSKTTTKNKKKEDMIELSKKETAIIDEQLKETDPSTSMRELIEDNKKKIVWKGKPEDLIHFFDQLYGQRLLNVKSYDEIFSIASFYFVNEKGEPLIIEKSASAKMNLNGPKIPAGYERYMKGIEKLKSEK